MAQKQKSQSINQNFDSLPKEKQKNTQKKTFRNWNLGGSKWILAKIFFEKFALFLLVDVNQ